MTAQAHAVVREYELVEVWGRSNDKAAAVAAGLIAHGLPAQISSDLDDSVAAADTISCVTGTTSLGAWVNRRFPLVTHVTSAVTTLGYAADYAQWYVWAFGWRPVGPATMGES